MGTGVFGVQRRARPGGKSFVGIVATRGQQRRQDRAVDRGHKPQALLVSPFLREFVGDGLQGLFDLGNLRGGSRIVLSRAAEVLQRRKKEAEAEPTHSSYVFPGNGKSGHIVALQHPHEDTVRNAKLEPFEFYCWRHTFGTRAAQSGMDRYSLARLMGHSSPAVAARYYVHVTETHVAAGFGKFVEYQTRNVAEGIAAAFPEASDAVQ